MKTLDIYLLLPCPHSSIDRLPLSKDTNQAHEHMSLENSDNTSACSAVNT